MTVNPLLFWGIAAMAALGFIQAVWSKFREAKPYESPFEAPAAEEAPEGFRWVLMTEAEASAFRASKRL